MRQCLRSLYGQWRKRLYDLRAVAWDPVCKRDKTKINGFTVGQMNLFAMQNCPPFGVKLLSRKQHTCKHVRVRSPNPIFNPPGRLVNMATIANKEMSGGQRTATGRQPGSILA